MNNQLVRPALGETASIGTFYNARNDSFLASTLLSSSDVQDFVSCQNVQKSTTQLSNGESYKEKFGGLSVGVELAASILSGVVQPGKFTRYVNDINTNGRLLRAAIHHNIITTQEKIDLMNRDLKSYIKQSTLRTSEVTHIVLNIEYGAQTVLLIDHWLRPGIKKDEVESEFRQQVEVFADAVKNCPSNYSQIHPGGALPLEIAAYGTTLGSEGIVMQNLEEAAKFIECVSLQIKSKAGRGDPVIYRLVPIDFLTMVDLVQVHSDSNAIYPNPENLQKFIEVFDQFRACRQRLFHHHSYVSKNKLCLPSDYVHDVENRVQSLDKAERSLKADFARILYEVRNGKTDVRELWQLLTEFSQGKSSPDTIATFSDEHREKVAFIDRMVSQGAIYIGYNGLDLKTQLAKRGNTDAYILSFSEKARQDHASWRANADLLSKLLSDPRRNNFIAIADCDATGADLDKAVIAQYQNGSEIVSNLLEERQYLAENAFARCSPQSLERHDIKKPLQRRFVKIYCPGRDCDHSVACDWQCSECRALLEYGFSDQYIYCDCGRSLYSNYEFKCSANTHPQSYERYGQQELLALLNSLDQSNYINVLILGETGVGKSTFINAFVNYLYFQSLDDALKCEELQSVIPCSFSTQTMDRSKADSQIVETKIKVGMRDDEVDGSGGESATQRTTVYPITVGTVTYRLIDTPGIGDTRGLEYDKKNMADILTTISGYDDLHGILILLKSNNARLTAHFSFCIKELLTHLHRSATNNVVFGFTNTRISNYMPGDTFGSLKTLLNERSDIGLSLSTQTTYCFDSESFRYLAATKQGVHMDNKSDFDGSWTKSSAEAWRMLNHFTTRTPHPIRSTVSLNGTRKVIIELTKPMAEISQMIRTNIATTEDEMKELADARLTGNQLKTKLHPQKQLIKRKPLDKPRTVCGDKACVEFKDDGTGTNTMLADYPKPCHPICYLQDVKVDVLAHPGLIRCAAFLGEENCNQCSHHWSVHMHVLYELEVYTTTVKDVGIEKQIKEHATDLQLKQAAIKKRKELIEEYKKEHHEIRDAAAKFGLWMKDNSIMAYNDATLQYLEMLIEAEQAKVDAGGIGNKARVTALKQDVEKHKQLVEILTKSMASEGKSAPIDQQGVNDLIKHLYKLPHFGKNLETLKDDIAQSHDQTNRELPHRVRGARTTNKWQYTVHTQPRMQPMVVTRQPTWPSSVQNNLHPMMVQNLPPRSYAISSQNSVKKLSKPAPSASSSWGRWFS